MKSIVAALSLLQTADTRLRLLFATSGKSVFYVYRLVLVHMT